MSGEALQGLAEPDIDTAPKTLIITGSLYILTLLVFGGRLYIRVQHRQLDWDDYTITFAMVLSFIEWSLFFAAVQHGAGRHNYYIPPDSQITSQRLCFASTLVWAPAMMFIKVSIACMIYRIKHTHSWFIFLWTMVVIQIISCSAYLVFQLEECLPLSATWDSDSPTHGRCAAPTSILISQYVISGIDTSSSLIFAFIPAIFISKTCQLTRTNVALALLMGLGVFTAAACIMRMTLLRVYETTGDTLWCTSKMTLWNILEQQAGIIASCIPCVGSPLERTWQKTRTLFSIAKQESRGSHIHGDIRMGTPLTSITSEWTIGRSTDTSSRETIWQGGAGEQESGRLGGEGGIMRTMEFDVQSEVVSYSLSFVEEHRKWRGDSGVV